MDRLLSLANSALTILFITVVLYLIVIQIYRYFFPESDLHGSGGSLKNKSDPHLLKNAPAVLEGALLFLNEQPIHISSPLKVHGRVDQVFKTPTGILVPIDTKNRDSILAFESDKIQLSIYGMILRHKGFKVSDNGYVRIPNKGNPVYIPVKLGDDEYVARHVAAYKAIKMGKIIPMCKCGKCLT